MASMNKPCYAAIKQHSPSKPVIIFVASRRQTRLTAEDLVNYAAGDDTPTSFLGCSDEYIYEVSMTLDDASLRHTITYGIGLHHVSSNNRKFFVLYTSFSKFFRLYSYRPVCRQMIVRCKYLTETLITES